MNEKQIARVIVSCVGFLWLLIALYALGGWWAVLAGLGWRLAR